MSPLLLLSINIFKDLSQPDSIVVMLYLCTAFLIGGLTFWLTRNSEIKSLKNTIAKQSEELKNYNAKNQELTAQTQSDNNRPSGDAFVDQHILSDLNQQVTELKQANFYLRKDYNLALEALSSAKEQAEEMQQTIKGANILPQTTATFELKAAREKVKSYLSKRLNERSEQLSFQKELTQKIGEQSATPIDLMDEEMLLALAELIPETNSLPGENG